MNPYVVSDMINSRQDIPFQATSTPLFSQGAELTNVVRPFDPYHEPRTPRAHSSFYDTVCRYKVQIGCGIAAAAVAVGYYWYSSQKKEDNIEDIAMPCPETLPIFPEHPKDVDTEVKTYFGLIGGNKLYEEFVQGDETEDNECHYPSDDEGDYTVASEEKKKVLGICRCCHQREANSMIIPCGHRFYCDKCSQRVVLASKRKKMELIHSEVTGSYEYLSQVGGGVVELRCPFDNTRVNRFMTVA